MNKLFKIIPHLQFILSAMFIVFLILNNFNPTMMFLANNISYALLWILCIITFINAIYLIIKKK